MENKKNKVGDILEGKITFNTNGSSYFTSENISKDIYIHKYKVNKSLHLDTVKIKVIEGRGRDIEGEVIEIIERNKTEFVGTIQLSEKHAFFIPDNKKINVDFFIPLDKLNGALHNQKVLIKLTEWGKKSKSPNGEVIKILGNSGEHETEIHAILEEYSLPYEFTDELLSEADLISEIITEEEISKRRDLRNIITISIDPEDSKDADDTLTLEWINGECIVYINIADVSHYLKEGTELDKEAYNRGNSVYLVDRCIPMLPERLSNNICSLKSGSDKLCFSAIFKMNKNGDISERWFGRTIINVNKDYSYEEAQLVIENGVREEFKDTDNVVIELNKIAKNLKKERNKLGVLSINNNEIKFKLDNNNKPIEIYFKESKDSNKLIEEFMLLANKEVAKFIKSKGVECINRIHEKPDDAKLESLRNFVTQLGYTIHFNEPDEIKSILNKLLDDSKNMPEGDIISNLITRSQKKAIYSTSNIGHYGLGFLDYSHFTSPIRRFSDTILHRILEMVLPNKGYLTNDEIISKSNIKINKLETKCNHITQREIRAQKAERDSNKYMQTIYMSDRIGKIYKGIVTSITEHGFFVELIETKSEGFIRLSEMTNDKYVADVKNYCVKGSMTGEKIKLGDDITVIVKSVDIEKRNINFSIIRF